MPVLMASIPSFGTCHGMLALNSPGHEVAAFETARYWLRKHRAG